jgi:hypothetical protein
MNRRNAVVAVLGLVLAGCAAQQDRDKEIDPSLLTATIEIKGMS